MLLPATRCITVLDLAYEAFSLITLMPPAPYWVSILMHSFLSYRSQATWMRKNVVIRYM